MKISFSRHGDMAWLDIETDDGSRYHLLLLLGIKVINELGLLDKTFIEEVK